MTLFNIFMATSNGQQRLKQDITSSTNRAKVLYENKEASMSPNNNSEVIDNLVRFGQILAYNPISLIHGVCGVQCATFLRPSLYCLFFFVECIFSVGAASTPSELSICKIALPLTPCSTQLRLSVLNNHVVYIRINQIFLGPSILMLLLRCFPRGAITSNHLWDHTRELN